MASAEFGPTFGNMQNLIFQSKQSRFSAGCRELGKCETNRGETRRDG